MTPAASDTLNCGFFLFYNLGQKNQIKWRQKKSALLLLSRYSTFDRRVTALAWHPKNPKFCFGPKLAPSGPLGLKILRSPSPGPKIIHKSRLREPHLLSQRFSGAKHWWIRLPNHEGSKKEADETVAFEDSVASAVTIGSSSQPASTRVVL